MYTNRANLLHTIAVQQRLFRQQLADGLISPTTSQDLSAGDNDKAATVQPAENVQHGRSGVGSRVDGSGVKPRLEWVVRKRSDGSRYVTRRPSRTRGSASAATAAGLVPPIHDAAVTADRPGWGGETTTDEEEVEQPKAGRYWTREQRRQHVAEKRHREAMKLMMKATSAAAAACGATESGNMTTTNVTRSRARRTLVNELAVVGRPRDVNVRGHGQLLSVATV
jgi:ligand of Numb protein X 3/4